LFYGFDGKDLFVTFLAWLYEFCHLFSVIAIPVFDRCANSLCRNTFTQYYFRLYLRWGEGKKSTRRSAEGDYRPVMSFVECLFMEGGSFPASTLSNNLHHLEKFQQA
jgi:hypothetical protein